MDRTFNSRPRIRAAAFILACSGLALGMACFAQPASTGTPLPSWFGQSQPAPSDITGKDFGGVRLPSAVERADLTISASRAWVWSEGGSARVIGADGLPVSTQRMFLQGDVTIESGRFKFTAAQAVVWVQTLATTGAIGEDRATRQIAISFDRVSDPGAEAGYAQAADRLVVTATLDGSLALRADALTPGQIDGASGGGKGAFLVESEQRLARLLRGLLGGTDVEFEPEPTPVQAPGVVRGQITPGLSRPYEPNSPIARQRVGTPGPVLPPQERVEPLFARDGIVTFAAGTRAPNAPTAPEFGEAAPDSAFIRVLRGEENNTLLLTGGVALQYTDLRKSRNLLITSERAIVFLAPGPLKDLGRFGVDAVQGVYLEGDVVATDGQYTLRGPRVYYDFKLNKAVMADAVFSTIDQRSGLPVYVRASTLRQEAANKVSAENARLSTTSFFDPVFSLGASKITVTQAPRASSAAAPGSTITFVEAKNITLRGLGVPFFWLPGFRGEVDEIPLEDVRVENSSGSGAALKTTWNALSILGLDRPEGLRVRALVDYYFDRGPALGTRTSWNTLSMNGQIFGYIVPEDQGRDVLVTGEKKDGEDEFRGMVLAENRWDITPNWSLFAEGAYVSDETFIDGFFDKIAEEGREVASSIRLRYIEGNSVFSLQAKGTFNDFSPNQYIQQSQGFTVNKLPEGKYARLADDILGGVQPGLLTWTHEYSVARVGFSFNEPRAEEFGFTSDALSQRAFGVNANQSIADRLRAAGLNEKEYLRYDTRQELSAVLDLSAFRINPFIVGRFTGYEEKLGEIATYAGSDADDQYRAWWAAGSRFSTQLVRIDDAVQSELFDLNRIRHIIEPSATVWTAGSTVRQESLAPYDPDVEGINTGSAVRAGVTNTFQTQRGGPGRTRSVDVLKVSTDFTFSTADRNQSSPFGRFFDYRPEYSVLGNYFTGDVAWQVTDAVGLTFNQIYDFTSNQPERTVAGGLIQHSPEFSTYAQVRFLNPLDATYVDFGASYQLTRVYSVGAQLTYDTDESEIQNVSGFVRRRMREATLGVRIAYNSITEESSIGVLFEPQAADQRQAAQQRGERLREIGR
ncbi:MAG: hypothetical protein K2W85_16910 [Phycisphaerales bacterium]|nr:hypothetical protein [Phycisphaerales bacterium]